MGKLLWDPTEEQQSQSEINTFKQRIEGGYQLFFVSYHGLWVWSTEHIADFWESVATYFKIEFYLNFTSVLDYPADRDSFIGTKWFNGGTLNYAEHIFRRGTGTDTNTFSHSNGFLQR